MTTGGQCGKDQPEAAGNGDPGPKERAAGQVLGPPTPSENARWRPHHPAGQTLSTPLPTASPRLHPPALDNGPASLPGRCPEATADLPPALPILPWPQPRLFHLNSAPVVRTDCASVITWQRVTHRPQEPQTPRQITDRLETLPSLGIELPVLSGGRRKLKCFNINNSKVYFTSRSEFTGPDEH